MLMTISPWGIFWGLIISMVGMVFFVYGKKRPDAVTLITGIVLMIYPYFIGSAGWIIGTGIGIIAVYIFLKRVVQL